MISVEYFKFRSFRSVCRWDGNSTMFGASNLNNLTCDFPIKFSTPKLHSLILGWQVLTACVTLSRLYWHLPTYQWIHKQGNLVGLFPYIPEILSLCKNSINNKICLYTSFLLYFYFFFNINRKHSLLFFFIKYYILWIFLIWKKFLDQLILPT